MTELGRLLADLLVAGALLTLALALIYVTEGLREVKHFLRAVAGLVAIVLVDAWETFSRSRVGRALGRAALGLYVGLLVMLGLLNR